MQFSEQNGLVNIIFWFKVQFKRAQLNRMQRLQPNLECCINLSTSPRIIIAENILVIKRVRISYHAGQRLAKKSAVQIHVAGKSM